MRYPLILILFLIFCFRSSSAEALLLGDFINLGHALPQQDEVIEGDFVTVEAGASDQLLFNSLYTVNPEDEYVDYRFIRPFSFSPDPFNGPVVNFIDTPISKVTVETNVSGWDLSRLQHNQDSFALNWSGLEVQSDSYFLAHLTAVQSPSTFATPEPPTFLLVTAGLIGGWFMKKRHSQNH